MVKSRRAFTELLVGLSSLARPSSKRAGFQRGLDDGPGYARTGASRRRAERGARLERFGGFVVGLDGHPFALSAVNDLGHGAWDIGVAAHGARFDGLAFFQFAHFDIKKAGKRRPAIAFGKQKARGGARADVIGQYPGQKKTLSGYDGSSSTPS